MKRRDFLSWVSLGWLAGSLPVAIAACSPQGSETISDSSSASPPRPSIPTDPGGFKPVDTVPALDKAGFLKADIDGKPVIVIRDPADTSKILALSSVCTHKGCLVDWKASEKRFVCPCHQSDFASDGKVLEGPAEKPLPVYRVKVDGSTILVKTA